MTENACIELSSIMACRGLENSHQEEEAFSKALESLKHSREIIANAAEQTGAEHLICALAYLDCNWNQIGGEFEALKAKCVVEAPLCGNAYLGLAGDENEYATELAVIRLLILQAECDSWG